MIVQQTEEQTKSVSDTDHGGRADWIIQRNEHESQPVVSRCRVNIQREGFVQLTMGEVQKRPPRVDRLGAGNAALLPKPPDLLLP